MKNKFLIFLILLNLILVFVVIIAEQQGRVIGLALERRGYITMDEKVHPDYAIRKSWESCIRNLHSTYDAAFFGNSITRGGDFQKYFPDRKLINLGLSGDNLIGMKLRVSMLKACNPKKIFIMAGTNDLHHLSISQFKEKYTSLFITIRDSLPLAQLYFESILPMNNKINSNVPSDDKIREANQFIRELASQGGGFYIDLYSLYVKEGQLPEEMTEDGLHLKSYYYRIWIDEIRKYME